MRKKYKQKLNWISTQPLWVTIPLSALAVGLYFFFAIKYELGVNMDAGTIISTDIALITIIITTIGLSISGYIFLNNYFGTVVEGDRSLTSIIEELNKTYIRKIFYASFASMVFIACAFIVIFKVKDTEIESFCAFLIFLAIRNANIEDSAANWIYFVQYLTYVGSIGSILYNFHFLCHIINPDQLIKKKAFIVANEQMKFLVRKYRYIPDMYTNAGWEWKECKEFSKSENNIGVYAGVSSDKTRQTLGIVKYIYEIESIITKVIESNALEGENRSEEEALKFVFADTRVGTVKYERRMAISSISKYFWLDSDKSNDLVKYERAMSELIEQYVVYYDRLVLLKNALIKMDKVKIENLEIKDEVYYFVIMMMRVTLKLFSNFVKMTNLNVGGGYFAHAYLNWSDLSGSNLTGSDFSEANMQGAIFTESDLSISKLNKACINDGDFRNVNLGYASLIGAECVCINLTNAKLTDVIFHSPYVIRRHEMIREKILNIFQLNNVNFEMLKECSFDVVKNGKEIEKREKEEGEKITNLSAATLDNVVLKSVDFSAVKLRGASFDYSVLTNSLWLYTTKAVGIKARNANLRNIVAVQSDFSMSDFQNANLGGAFFIDVNMDQSNLADINGVSMKIYGSSEKISLFSNRQEACLPFNARQFSSKDFRTGQITEKSGVSKWVQVNLQNMNAVESQWCNTLVNESDFTDAILKNTVWKNIGANWVNMENCDMTYAAMSEVSFRMAKMPSCIFTRAMLQNVSFENANLYKSNFIHAYIQNTDFIQCNLEYAIFSHAVIRNSRFINCGVHEIYLQSTLFKNVLFDCNSFLVVLKSYNVDKRIKFDSCVVQLDDFSEYIVIYSKVRDEGDISIKRKRNGSILLINAC